MTVETYTLYQFLKYLDDEIQRRTNSLVSGNAVDYAGYRAEVGGVQALIRAKTEIKEQLKKMSFDSQEEAEK